MLEFASGMAATSGIPSHPLKNVSQCVVYHIDALPSLVQLVSCV